MPYGLGTHRWPRVDNRRWGGASLSHFPLRPAEPRGMVDAGRLNPFGERSGLRYMRHYGHLAEDTVLMEDGSSAP